MQIVQYLKFVISTLNARFEDFAFSVVGRTQLKDSWLYNARPVFFFSNEERNSILL